MWSVDEIIEMLEDLNRRATYGAVAAVAGGIALGVMQGRPRTMRNSWVVAKKNGLPTGYSKDELHPRLHADRNVISRGHELRSLLGKWINQ